MDYTSPLPIVGLTGGIASGKTTVTDLMEQQGVSVIDADLLARETVAPNTEGLELIRQKFGEEILRNDGTLDRKALGHIVFHDSASRAWLEDLLHPKIAQLANKKLSELAASVAPPPYVVYSAALLVETLEKASPQPFRYHRIVVVDLPQATQQERLVARNACSDTQARDLIAQQASRQCRLAYARDVIDNGRGYIALQKRVSELLKAFTRRY